ncbi:MAG: rod shape-determining protein MreC, partial [Desulfovibrionales bacterium]
MQSRFGRIFWILVLPFFAYLTLYTWNLRTGYLDRLSERTGLELVGWVLAPGEWTQEKITFLWGRYVHLVDVSRENHKLREQVHALKLDMIRYREQASQAQRLRNLLSMPPPPEWNISGADIIGKRLGPNASLQTALLDAGLSDGITDSSPV